MSSAVIGERVRALAAIAIVVVLLSVVAGTVVSLLAPDVERDISRVLIAGPPLQSVTTGMNFIEDGGNDSVISDFAAGIRLALFGLLAVGIPLGLCAKALTTGDRWSRLDDQWGRVFQIGFVLQLVSLVLAAGTLLVYATDGLDRFKSVPIFAVLLAGDVVIGGMALPSWRSLQERRGHPPTTA
jgi:hypothetical protein